MNGSPKDACAPPAQLRELAREHGVFLREFGKVQDRVTRFLLHKDAEVRSLSGELFRLRGQLLVARTALLWGEPCASGAVATQGAGKQ